MTPLGITPDDLEALRRISRTLRRWNKKCEGSDSGFLERDQFTGVPYWHNSVRRKRIRVRDMETGALKRLSKIMKRYPHLGYQVNDSHPVLCIEEIPID